VIEWSNLYAVALVSIFTSVLLVAVFAGGLRFLTNARHWAPAAKKGKSKARRNQALNSLAAYVSFLVCAAALLYGIYLIVPYFH